MIRATTWDYFGAFVYPLLAIYMLSKNWGLTAISFAFWAGWHSHIVLQASMHRRALRRQREAALEIRERTQHELT